MQVSIIGIGKVGATLAYTLLLRGACDRIVLHARNQERAQAEAADLTHAAALHSKQVRVHAGDVEATRGSQIIAVCASVPSGPGDIDERSDLAQANAQLMDTLLPPILERSPDAIVLMVANPVDTLSYHVHRRFDWPVQRVIGTGTSIDSARFRSLIAQDTGIHPDDIRAYILGEHGPHQFPALSVASVGGERADDPQRQRELFENARRSAYDVFSRKGYTSYAIARAAALIVQTILGDERRTIPVSTFIDDFVGVRDVYLSMPCVIGADGVQRMLRPPLDEAECALMREAAQAVRQVNAQLGW